MDRPFHMNPPILPFPLPMRRFRPAFLLLAGLAAGVGLQARPKEPAPAAVSPLAANLPLSLDDCRRLALAHNLVLRAQRETLASAGFLR